jgi:hypothetical protein
LYQDFHADNVVACRWREKIYANNFILYSQFENNKLFQQYLKGVLD